MRRRLAFLLTAVAMVVVLVATTVAAQPPWGNDDGPYEVAAPAFDISAAWNGSIMVAGGKSVQLIERGEVKTLNDVPIPDPRSTVNGVSAIGARSTFAATGGADKALDAGVWLVTKHRARLIGDITAFETQHDPDVAAGWKDPACEEDSIQEFTAGPQSNPYHLTRRLFRVFVADAAGNSLLSVRLNGRINTKAVFTPPLDNQGNYLFLKNAESDENIDCYVQPVPTSVAFDRRGNAYVGELTGSLENFGNPLGLSRVWKIKRGANNVVCSELAPSSDCELLIDGLTSVIDVEIGPDGKLYVVEYDKNSWFAAIGFAEPAGGSIKACDTNTGQCDVVADDLVFPSAITFDRWDGLWVLENNLAAPTVRRLED